MNGYVEFEGPEGDPVVVNVDRVNFVRRFKGGNEASALNFEKLRAGLREVAPVCADRPSSACPKLVQDAQ